jgi:hypothetical protein
MTIKTFSLPKDPEFIESNSTASGAGNTEAVRCCDEVCVQIGGSATAIDATPMRSPDGASDNYAPAGDDITGNPSLGITVKLYNEPSSAFWRLRINSISGTAKIHISGKASQ